MKKVLLAVFVVGLISCGSKRENDSPAIREATQKEVDRTYIMIDTLENIKKSFERLGVTDKVKEVEVEIRTKRDKVAKFAKDGYLKSDMYD